MPPPAVAHHAERVLRLAVGDAVTLFDGRGGECEPPSSPSARNPARWLGPGCSMPSAESPLAITLVQALASADKMDWVVQKAVELGVAAIQPVAAERSVLKLSGDRADKRRAHWQQIAVSACEQSGRNRGRRWRDPAAGHLVPQLLLRHADDPCARARARWPQAAPDRPGGDLIGPEGGWSPAELAWPTAPARRWPSAAGAAHRDRRARGHRGDANRGAIFPGDADV